MTQSHQAPHAAGIDSPVNRKFKGVWIPAERWLDRSLNITEKVMLAEIDSLETEDRGCYASNRYFAEFFGLSVSRISHIIAGLKEKGLITVELITEGNQLVERRIRLSTPFEKPNTPMLKTQGGYCENSYTPLAKIATPPCENSKVNSISINNTYGCKPNNSPGEAEGLIVSEPAARNEKAEAPAEAQVVHPDPQKTPRAARKSKAEVEDANSLAFLIAKGVDAEIANDWVKARRKKGASEVNSSLWTCLTREAEKANMTPQEAVMYAAAAGWRGFKADWLSTENSSPRERKKVAKPESVKQPTLFDEEVRYEDVVFKL